MQTWQDGLTVESITNHYKSLNIRSAVDIFKAESPVIGLLAKDSEEKTCGAIELMIIDLQSFLNINRTMNAYQIKETARLIINRYNFMKIADCRLVFDRLKTGVVKIFEGLDGQKILTAFEQWSEERLQSADNYSYNRHTENRNFNRRDKPFTIGDPDAPDPQKIENYINAVSELLKKF